jgi:hypothetical protein
MRTLVLLLLAHLGLAAASEPTDDTAETVADHSAHREERTIGAAFSENSPTFRNLIKEQIPPAVSVPVPVADVEEVTTTNTVETSVTQETTVEEEIEPEVPPPPPHHHHHHHPHHHHHHHCDFRNRHHDCPPDCPIDCEPHCPPHCPPECRLCLTDRIAHRLASTWLYFSINLNKRLAIDTLSEDFVFLSDSDNIAGNGPEGVSSSSPPLPGAEPR